MKVGKLNWDDLNSIIKDNIGKRREEVRVAGGIGEDCAIINYGDYECILSTDPITGASNGIGKLAVNININDIASSGGEPIGVLVTILVPPSSNLDDIKNIMKEIHNECKKLNIQVLGGHTEVTEAVNKIVVSCTSVGKTKKNMGITSKGSKIGDDIIVTKDLCMEAITIIYNDYYGKVKDIINNDDIKLIKDYENNLSVVEEGRIAGKASVSAMHDITEGGVLGAIFEMVVASDVGFIIDEDKLPISETTKKLCRELNLDPLRLISSGSMIITTKDGEKLCKTLKENNIKATIVGKITKKHSKLKKRDREVFVTPPKSDELFKL